MQLTDSTMFNFMMPTESRKIGIYKKMVKKNGILQKDPSEQQKIRFLT